MEASPHDNIWGIGLADSDPRCLDPAKWQGLNLLGKALVRVRETIAAAEEEGEESDAEPESESKKKPKV